MRKYIYILSLINNGIVIILLIVFSSIFNFRKVIYTPTGDLVIFDFFNALKNVFAYFIYLCLLSIANFISFGISRLFTFFPNYYAAFMYSFLDAFFRKYLSLWFFPSGEDPALYEIPNLVSQELTIFLNDIYLFAFQIFFLVAILFFVRAIFNTDPKYSLTAMGGLIMMLVLPLMVFGLRDMLDLFAIKVDFLEKLENPVSHELTNIPLDNFFRFLASPAALLAIICYIYLEISFQINYADTVTKPSLERSDRLETQLGIIKRESQLITANVDKIKEEAKKRREELGLEEPKISKFLAKTTYRFSYVKEMIEKRKLEEEEKKLVSAASKTRRLGRYIDRLFREDPEATDTLTAASSAPRAQSLITSTILNFFFRLTLLIIISFIIIHPRWFFINVFNLPPAITESIAMYSPEVIIILLVPFMLIFPVISYSISYIKHRNLIIRLKQEGRIKEILASVGDYVKKEQPLGEEKEEQSGETGQVATETA